MNPPKHYFYSPEFNFLIYPEIAGVDYNPFYKKNKYFTILFTKKLNDLLRQYAIHQFH